VLWEKLKLPVTTVSSQTSTLLYVTPGQSEKRPKHCSFQRLRFSTIRTEPAKSDSFHGFL
jgi:hypothetical protein